ncbi:MAG: amino acid permease [Acidobacteriia bacterium]|nr:amino acid permease [Terriglobia bacterium]
MMSDLPRKLGLADALAIVVGMIIGGGIFVVPNLVARSMGSGVSILALWMFAGLLSFCGALACAELGTAIPATGGQYVFLREAFGPLAGFLYGWSVFLVGRTAQISWLAVTLSLYVSYFVPVGPVESKLIGASAILVLATVNYCGVRAGALVQKSFALAKVAGLLVIIASGLLLGGHAAQVQTTPAPFSFAQTGVALIACLLAYDSWISVSFVAGEIKNPQRNVLLALLIGLAICITIYTLANGAYLHVLSIPEIAASDHVGASAAERVLGPVGGKLVSAIILLSMIGTLNGAFLTSPRIYFAQARDGLFFRRFGEVHPRFRTPAFAIAAQAVWAVVLLLSGTYETLADYAMFSLWVFYGLMILGLMVLRRRRPDLPRPYRMWGYPVTPLVFLAVAAWFLINTLVTRPGPALAGLAFIASGVPVYFVWRSRAAKTSAIAQPAGS